MKIPVKEILNISVLMDLFIVGEAREEVPYRLLFETLTDLNPEESKESGEVLFSKAVVSEKGSYFLILHRLDDNEVNTKVYGEYIYPSNGVINKKRFIGKLATFVNIFAM